MTAPELKLRYHTMSTVGVPIVSRLCPHFSERVPGMPAPTAGSAALSRHSNLKRTRCRGKACRARCCPNTRPIHQNPHGFRSPERRHAFRSSPACVPEALSPRSNLKRTRCRGKACRARRPNTRPHPPHVRQTTIHRPKQKTPATARVPCPYSLLTTRYSSLPYREYTL